MPRLPLPIKGVSDATSYLDTPPGFCPPEAMLNVVPFNKNGRPQLGKRQGLVKAFQGRIGVDGNRKPQGMRVISRAAAVTTFVLGAATVLGIDQTIVKNAGLIDYNAALMALATQGIREAIKVTGSGGQAVVRRDGAPEAQNLVAVPAGFPNTPTASWCAMHPTETLACVAFNFMASSQNQVLLVFLDPKSGDVIGSKVIAPLGEDTASTQNVSAIGFAWTSGAIWIARGTALWYVPTPVLGGKARLLDPATVTAQQSTPDPAYDLSGAASRIVAMATYASGSNVYLLAAFEGNTASGTYANPAGAITSGGYGKSFRSGIYRLSEQPDVADFTYKLVVDTGLGAAPNAADSYVEVSADLTTPVIHNSIRLSTILDRAPRGALPTAIDVDPVSGDIYIAFCNQGYGPNSGFLPDGSVAYSTMACFTGALLNWEIDAQSSIGGENGGKLAGVATHYPTDLPDEDGGNAGTTDKDGPAIRAVKFDSAGVCYAAGRINSGLFSVFCVETGSGQLRWRKGLEGNNATDSPLPSPGQAAHGVPRGGLGVDLSDHLPVAVGARNNSWVTTAVSSADTRPYALMWKLSSVDGSIQWGADAVQDTSEASLTSLAVGTGIALYGSSIFTDS